MRQGIQLNVHAVLGHIFNFLQNSGHENSWFNCNCILMRNQLFLMYLCIDIYFKSIFSNSKKLQSRNSVFQDLFNSMAKFSLNV